MNLTDAHDLLIAFRTAMRRTVDDREVGVLFSGGLDSTIVAILANEVAKVTLYTVGVEGSYDLEAGRSAAEQLGYPWHPIIIDEDAVMGAVKDMVRINGNDNPVSISFQIPLFFVASNAKERLLIGGQGADELFAGYARYEAMNLEEKGRQMEVDMMKLMKETLEQERSIAVHFSKDLRYPFLDKAAMDAVEAIPLERRVGSENSKEMLREVARLLGAADLAERKKKAAQYGSGAMRSLKSVAKRRGLSVRGLMASIKGVAD